MKQKYDIEGKKEFIYLLGRSVRNWLEKEGFNLRVHLAEPIHEATVYEYERRTDKIVITIDDASLGGSSLSVRSKDIDTLRVVHESTLDVIGELLEIYLKPLTHKKVREDILEEIRDLLKKTVQQGK